MAQNSPFQLDFVGIGAPKAGTTQVANLLAAHPQLCLSEPKEIHYFNQKSAYIHPPTNKNHSKDTAWYTKHFAHCSIDSLKGEFSTGYLYCSDAAANIKTFNPQVKIIACLRHPAERAYSQYVMFRYYFKKEDRPFDKVIREEAEFAEKSKYYKQLKRYFDLFDPSQILILSLEEIKKNPKEIAKKLYHFLGVDTSFMPPNIMERANSAKAIKLPIVSWAMGVFSSVMVGLGLSKVVNYLKEKGFKKWVIQLNSQQMDYPPMSTESRQYLLQQLKTDTEQLEQLLGQDFSHWKV